MDTQKLTRELVFETQNTSICQDDQNETYTINFFNNKIELKPCAFIAFREKIRRVNILNLFNKNEDIVIISLFHCERIFVFSIIEILELQDLFNGAFAQLELNSIIKQKINPQLV